MHFGSDDAIAGQPTGIGTAPPPGLCIGVRTAIGHGPTELAAFDDALRIARIENFNLIALSSVIPPGARVDVLATHSTHRPEGQWGDRLYVVMAHATATRGHGTVPESEIAAGIGWVQDPATGRGLFVEHEDGNEERVRADIALTLDAMVASRPESFGPIRDVVVAAPVPHTGAVCALAVATYETEPWVTSSEPRNS